MVDEIRDEATPMPLRSRRRRVLRALGLTSIGLVAFVVVVGVVGFWLLGRETTLQRLVSEGEKALGGQLRVDGVSGSLYDRIAFKRLVFRSKTQVITIDDGALRYRLEPFAHRFTIVDAWATKLTIETIAKSDEPASEPATLELPSSLHLDAIRLDAVHLDAIALVDRDRSTVFGPADLVGRYERDDGVLRWTIARLALQTPWGLAEGSGSLDAKRPFRIDATVKAKGTFDDVPYEAPLVLRGKLADLAITSDFTVSDPTHAPLAGHADTRVLPFRDQPIDRATLHVDSFSPKRWKDTLPEADVTIDAAITPRASTSGAASNPFDGTLRVTNAAPGPIDRGRMPVAGIEAALHGDSTAIVFDLIVADLGAAGSLNVRGRYDLGDHGGPALEGSVAHLDLKAIQTTLIPTRFTGPVAVSRHDGTITFDTTLVDTGRRVAVAGSFADRTLTLKAADLVVGGSHVDASGKLDLSKDRPFAIDGTVAHVDPHDFGDFAKADFNGAFHVDGKLGMVAESRRPGELVVAADVRIDPSRVLGRPLAGTVVGRVAGALSASTPKGRSPFVLRSIDGARVAVALGSNRITADGDFGGVGNTLRWTVDAPRLAELDAKLAGSLEGRGALGGTLDAPSLEFTIAGDGLRYASTSPTPGSSAANASRVATASTSFRLATLRANGRVQSGPKGTVDVTASLSDFRDGPSPTSTVKAASLRVEGTRDAHKLTITASSDRFDATIAGAGGLDLADTWHGVVDRLESRGRVPFALAGTVPVVAGPDQVRIGTAALKFQEGQVDLDHLEFRDGRLDTSGRANGFPLSIVGTLSKDFAARLSTTLKFGATWDLKAGDKVDGRVRLFREAGGLRFLTEPRFDVDVDKLELAADIVADHVTTHVVAVTHGLGNVDATVETTLAKRDGHWGMPADAPFKLTSKADIPDLRGLARLADVPGLEVGGSIVSDVNGQGTIGHPSLGGQVSGQSLVVRWPDQGVNVHDGRFDLSFDGDRMVLGQAMFAAGRGSMKANGDLRLVDGHVDGTLGVDFEHFEAVARSDRTMVVSGSGGLRFGPTGIDVTGDVKADRGVLQLAERHGPTMSSDIVLVGRDEDSDSDKAPAKSVPVRFEVKFDMGDDFGVKGSGFDGKLGGTIRLTGAGSDLRAIGTVVVREGTYEGYGQKLTVTRGNLIFSGPIDNPALDIIATRKNLAVEAGVQVSGTALSPVAKLVSTPDVPDTEKLSWLMLGHGLAGATKSDYASLATAAAGLLGSSDSTGIQSRIAATLGVDQVGFTTDSTTGAGLLTIGKQISSRLRVNFEQGITKAATLIKVRYNIYQRIDLQVTTGTESALDIFYTFSFH